MMEVDMEASTGLMPQIQALIAPPPSDSPPKVKRKEVAERRRGKGQNRDTCDACGECGNLICCDKCPTALHLQCQDPPLDDDDVPLGEWLCRACRAKAKPKDKKCLDETAPPEDVHPIELLMRAAMQQNPVQYELQKNLELTTPFPGADKGPKKVVTRRSSAMKKNVPDPVKVCFECRRGVRVAPLLHCDYCSLSFHLDCLNPPLTAPPSGTTWMCPNHVEHFIDSNLLSSTSGTERAQLWDKYGKDLDHQALKLEFLRKASRKNPPFRYKVQMPDRQKTVIPAAVAKMYKSPLSLVPALPNHVTYEKTWKPGVPPTQIEVEEWLSSLFAMQASLAWDMTLKANSNETDSDLTEAIDRASDNKDGTKPMLNSTKKHQKLNRAAIEKFCSLLDAESGQLDAQMSKMDPRLLKVLACQRLQQLMPHFVGMNNSSLQTAASVHGIAKVKVKEETPATEVYASFDENLFLKNGIVCAKKKYVALKDVNGDLKVEEWRDVRQSREKSTDESDDTKNRSPPARAALASLGSTLRMNPVSMRWKTLFIGTSPDSDVCLTDFGHCHLTSPKHAVIFFDAMTGEFELLNYSPHGSVVDGCLYCIDSTQCRIPTAPSIGDPLTQGVRAMLDKRRGIKREQAPVVNNRAPRHPVKNICACQERVSDPTGWEGSALLHHCSHLQFGCLQFVFSIVDFAPIKNLTPDAVEKKRKKLNEDIENDCGKSEDNGPEKVNAIKSSDDDIYA